MAARADGPTRRLEIADCLERSYETLTVAAAQKLLMCDTAAQLAEFVDDEERQARRAPLPAQLIHLPSFLVLA